jgi:dTDP-4-dehydrorhamnose reductase
LKRPLILVTGYRGQLGSEIVLASKNFKTFDFLHLDREEADLTIESSFLSFVGDKPINYIINCAAYTAVDQAEVDQENATRLNAGVPAMLADYCLKNNARLIHISTDYVFDGNGNTPIHEDTKPNPASVYGKTKLSGEDQILKRLSNAYILRTAWVYSVFGKNFVKTMLALAKQKKELNVIYDQIGTPTNARDLAMAILKIIDSVEKGFDQPGIYHYSNEGVTSWYDFSVAIFKLANVDCKVSPIFTKDYKTAAVRPLFTLLDKSKIKRTFNLSIPHWMESLEVTINELK